MLSFLHCKEHIQELIATSNRMFLKQPFVQITMFLPDLFPAVCKQISPSNTLSTVANGLYVLIGASVQVDVFHALGNLKIDNFICFA